MICTQKQCQEKRKGENMTETISTVKAKISRKHKTPAELQQAIEKHEARVSKLRERLKKESLTIKIDIGSWFLWYLTKGEGVKEVGIWQEKLLAGLDKDSKLYEKRLKSIEYIIGEAQKNAPEAKIEPKNDMPKTESIYRKIERNIEADMFGNGEEN